MCLIDVGRNFQVLFIVLLVWLDDVREDFSLLYFYDHSNRYEV